MKRWEIEWDWVWAYRHMKTVGLGVTWFHHGKFLTGFNVDLLVGTLKIERLLTDQEWDQM